MYFTWSLLFPSCSRYIPNMDIDSFAWRYWIVTISIALLVDSKEKSCPGFLHFHFLSLHSQSTRYYALLSGARQTPVIIINSSHSNISSCICEWVASISTSYWIISQLSTKLYPINCSISVVKGFYEMDATDLSYKCWESYGASDGPTWGWLPTLI